MIRIIIQKIVLFIFLVLLQVMVLNNINIIGYATPFLYIYFIIGLPVITPRNLVITLGFLLGLVIDIFSNTLGMHAFSATLVAFLRYPLLTILSPRDEFEVGEPSVATLGFSVYLSYVSLIILILCISLYALEAFSLFNPLNLLIKILSSTLLTTALLFTIDSIKPSRK